MAAGSYRKGIHTPHRKNTANAATAPAVVPGKVLIPMVQHIGVACAPTVKKGDRVLQGQVIGDAQAFVSAPVHASVSGTVTAVEPMPCYGNRHVVTVEIKPDEAMEPLGTIAPPVIGSTEEFLQAVRASGLTGLGGAGFPAHVKLKIPPDKPVDTLIINAAECEPYITSDYRECIERPEQIIDGILQVLKWTGIPKAVIGIEDNKPEAARILAKAAGASGVIRVEVLKSLYPQGAERTLIYALTGRKVRTGKLPSDAGCLVMNVGSASFLSGYLRTGMPLIKKRITVDGPVVRNPGNLEAYIGTPVSEAFARCGGFTAQPEKLLMGGPMMGVALYSGDVPVIKNTNALLALDRAMGELPEETACIRCGRCVENCPMGMMPLEVNRIVVNRAWDTLGKYNVMDCIECGCCSYVCPAKRFLVQSMRLAKEYHRKRFTAK